MQLEQLADRVADWAQRGLLTDEQGRRILEYEGGRAAGRRRSWVLYGLLMLGGTVVGIGVISLIAANWEAIPSAAKLCGAFAVLAALGWLAYRAREEGRSVRFELCALLLAMGVLGTIALVAQVYHSGGEPFLALALWLLAIAPLAYECRRGLVPQLWVAGSVATLAAWILAEEWWKAFGFDWDHQIVWSVFLGVPLLCLLLGNLGARRPALRAFSRGYTGWAHAGALEAIVAVDLFWSLGRPRAGGAWVVVLVALGLAAAGTLWLRDDVPGKGRLAGAALVAVGLLAFAPFALDLDGGHHHRETWSAMVGAACSVVGLLLLAALFAARDRRRWFNLMTVLVGVRLLIVYLQVFGNLATTGLGLVVSGLVIIGVALLWYRTRARVEALVGGLVR